MNKIFSRTYCWQIAILDSSYVIKKEHQADNDREDEFGSIEESKFIQEHIVGYHRV